MNTFEAMCRAARDADVDAGHAPADVQWGRYEVLVRAALETMRERRPYTCVGSILDGKS